jgi:hypothetical protein
MLQYPAAIRYEEASQIVLNGNCNTTQKNWDFLKLIANETRPMSATNHSKYLFLTMC